ncbi:hypothetical protein AX279_19575 [Pseudomonas sp. J237]|nr:MULTISPECIES: hypothetical protein [Pseudomonas]OEO24036.1 hypothetical protein AX279_19575 [Pseudomonas sp. J237]
MSLPVSGLKDDELLHYAALDPDAAAELTRRIASDQLDPSAQLEELREEIRALESHLSDSEDEINSLQSHCETACELIRRAVNHSENEPLSISDLLKAALNNLE